MPEPQRTVTEEVVCDECRSVGRWRMYARRGDTRYFTCRCCGHRRVDRVVVKLKGLKADIYQNPVQGKNA